MIRFVAVAGALAALAVLSAPVAAGDRAALGQGASEATLLAAVNEVRVARGLRPLRRSGELAAAARAHSLDMGRRGYFAHDAPKGPSFAARIARRYPRRGAAVWAAGENLLWASVAIDAKAVVARWMRSRGHRANLLSRHWREAGLAAVRFSAAPGTYRGLDVTIVAANFGVRE